MFYFYNTYHDFLGTEPLTILVHKTLATTALQQKLNIDLSTTQTMS